MSAQTLQPLTDEVAAQTEVVASAVTLINGLAAKLEASKNDPSAIQELANSLKSNRDALAAAVVANTPSEV